MAENGEKKMRTKVYTWGRTGIMTSQVLVAGICTGLWHTGGMELRVTPTDDASGTETVKELERNYASLCKVLYSSEPELVPDSAPFVFRISDLPEEDHELLSIGLTEDEISSSTGRAAEYSLASSDTENLYRDSNAETSVNCGAVGGKDIKAEALLIRSAASANTRHRFMVISCGKGNDGRYDIQGAVNSMMSMKARADAYFVNVPTDDPSCDAAAEEPDVYCLMNARAVTEAALGQENYTGGIVIGLAADKETGITLPELAGEGCRSNTPAYILTVLLLTGSFLPAVGELKTKRRRAKKQHPFLEAWDNSSFLNKTSSSAADMICSIIESWVRDTMLPPLEVLMKADSSSMTSLFTEKVAGALKAVRQNTRPELDEELVEEVMKGIKTVIKPGKCIGFFESGIPEPDWKDAQQTAFSIIRYAYRKAKEMI